MQNPTPTVLDCAQFLLLQSKKSLKNKLTGYWYVTNDRKSCYEMPKGILPFSEMAKYNKVKPAKSSKESLVLLLQYRNNFGKSLRQRNIRADDTKDSAGTMPAYVYANRNIVQLNPIDLGEETQEVSSVDLPSNTVFTDAEVLAKNEQGTKLYRAGEVFVLKGQSVFKLGHLEEDIFNRTKHIHIDVFINSVEDCLHFENNGKPF